MAGHFLTKMSSNLMELKPRILLKTCQFQRGNFDLRRFKKAQRNVLRCKSSEEESSPLSSSNDIAVPEKKSENQIDLKKWGQFSLWMFGFGFGMGPPLDGFHSAVGLQVYDSWAITIGAEPDGLHTSLWVFPLLGAFYAILGSLQLILDRRFSTPDTVKQGSWTAVLTTMGVLIGLLRLSAQLYEDEDWSTSSIFAVLAVCAHGNWFAFDKTWWGYLLALFVAVAAPVSEAILMRYLELWHYAEPDIFIFEEGIVSWTCWCYFFYTQWVGALARCFQRYIMPELLSGKAKPDKNF